MTDETILDEQTNAAASIAPPADDGAPSPGEQQPSAQPAPAREAPPAPQDRSGWVPIDAHLNEREKRQALERQVAEYRRAEQERARREEEASAEIPDMITDPAGYNAWVRNQIKRAEDEAYSRARGDVEQTQRVLSQRALVRVIGPERFNALVEWSKGAPAEVVRGWYESPDPYGEAWEDFQRAEEAQRQRSVLERFGNKDPDAWIEEEVQRRIAAAQGGAAPQNAEAARDFARDQQGRFAPSQQQPKHRPESLANVNGAAPPRNGEAISGYDRLMASKAQARRATN